uniref:C-type lectin domain-containing protein n=1 Tax=Labrus bergylta TaxID=56723 RepID=A0A3Q3G6R0_9LABR
IVKDSCLDGSVSTEMPSTALSGSGQEVETAHTLTGLLTNQITTTENRLFLTAVEVKKTWEGALEYCRETHTDLTTLQSDTEQLLTLSEIRHDHITGRVWIGLRFLGDHWLWVNGDPMVYENWRQGDQEHQCPLRKRCGALTKEGHWENWDCGEELHFICY